MLVVFTKNIGVLPVGKYINEGRINSEDVKKLFDNALEESITIYVVRWFDKLPISKKQKKALILNNKLVYVNKSSLRNLVKQCGNKRVLGLVPFGSEFYQYRMDIE